MRRAQAVRCFVTTLVAGLLAFTGLDSHATVVDDLYEVTLPIKGSRETAFAEALKAVAVRVSGRRDAANRLGASADAARQYVQRFSFTSDNQLQVAFDSASIERLLADSGLPVWGRERPLTLVLLNVPAASGPMWIEAGFPASERDIMEAAARERGLPLAWPTLDSQERSALSDGLPTPEQSMQIAARQDANAVLVGQARREPSGALTVHWTLVARDGGGSASGSLDEGVHLVADTFGRMYGAAAGSAETVNLEISGIKDLDDYAATMSYLEGMTLVRSVSVEQIAGDAMRFQLVVRGNATTLRRALALDEKLVPIAEESGVASERLRLRLQR